MWGREGKKQGEEGMVPERSGRECFADDEQAVDVVKAVIFESDDFHSNDNK